MFLDIAGNALLLNHQDKLNIALLEAINANSSSDVMLALAQGADPEARAPDGELLISKAMRSSGHLDIVPAFLAAGARVQVQHASYTKSHPAINFWVVLTSSLPELKSADWGPHYHVSDDADLLHRVHQYSVMLAPLLEQERHARVAAKRMGMSLSSDKSGPDLPEDTLKKIAMLQRATKEMHASWSPSQPAQKTPRP